VTASLDIRPIATQAEREACARLMSGSEPWTTLGRSYDESLAIVSDSSRESFWVEREGEWAGFLLLSMQGPFCGYIQTVCLRPESRGKGIGTEIVAWAEAHIFRESPNVFMCVSDFNPGAYKLYQKLGYEMVGRLENYLVQGSAEILLRKTAGPWSEFHATR
jgi:ribosomal-protein-alanine N-acetyltransferase